MANRENEIDIAIANRLVKGKGDASYFFYLGYVDSGWNNVNMVWAKSAYTQLSEKLGKSSFLCYIIYVGIEPDQIYFNGRSKVFHINPLHLNEKKRLVNELPEGTYLYDKKGGKDYCTKGTIQACTSSFPLSKKSGKNVMWYKYMAFVPQNKAALTKKIKIMRGTFTDPRDGKVYKTVKIGKQIWMAENLNYNAKGSKCYKNKAANGEKYGRLYDWETAKKACPAGWHLPSDKEWQTLVDFVTCKKKNAKYLKAKSGWDDYKGKSGNGTDKFGFSALPGGGAYPKAKDGVFDYVGKVGHWWTATENGSNYAFDRNMHYNSDDYASYDPSPTSNLYSVRCVKDNAKKQGGKNGKNNKTR